MYKKILVLLDGSQLAEAVLPYVTGFAHIPGSEEVILLTVIEGRSSRALRISEGYLHDHAARFQEDWRKDSGSAPVVRCVAINGLPGQTPDTILRFAEDNEVGLIMMTSHGRSGIDRWLMGSVAEKVLRGADIPVFLARSDGNHPEGPRGFKRILVPLDGSEKAEQALPHAEQIAKSASAEVTLLYVEPPEAASAGTWEKKDTSFRSRQGEDLATYFDSIASSLKKAGVGVKTKVMSGHPGQQIIQEAEAGLSDLIVMSSHGRTGLARWAFGSVADQVLHSSPTPVLLVRATVKGEVPRHLQGPLVYRCYNCGRRTYRETFATKDWCGLCHYLLKACGNCVHYDGLGCLLRRSEAFDTYPGNNCPEFEFRKTRLILR